MYILTTRPSVLLAAKKKTAAFALAFSDVRLPQTVDEHAKVCGLASRRNIALMRQLQRSGWTSAHAFTDYHYLFNAVLVLLLVRLIEPFPDPVISANQNDEDDIAFGISFLLQLGEKGNQSAVTSSNICVELRDIVQRILLARQQAIAVATQPPDIRMAGTYDYQPLNDPYGVMGGASTTVGNDVMHQWLQTGPYPSGP